MVTAPLQIDILRWGNKIPLHKGSTLTAIVPEGKDLGS